MGGRYAVCQQVWRIVKGAGKETRKVFLRTGKRSEKGDFHQKNVISRRKQQLKRVTDDGIMTTITTVGSESSHHQVLVFSCRISTEMA